MYYTLAQTRESWKQLLSLVLWINCNKFKYQNFRAGLTYDVAYLKYLLKDVTFVSYFNVFLNLPVSKCLIIGILYFILYAYMVGFSEQFWPLKQRSYKDTRYHGMKTLFNLCSAMFLWAWLGRQIIHSI